MSRLARWIPALSLLGSAWGCATQKPPARPAPAAVPAPATPPPAASPPAAPAPPRANAKAVVAGDGIDRIRVPLDGPAMGPSPAKVTIVEFTDFQCPFCARVVPTLRRIAADYPAEVELVFRHNPLPFHTDAPLAAEAAVAAEAQGKFWEMHDKLFANQQKLDRPSLDRYAREIGLDMGKFGAALDSHAGKARVDADVELARQVGAVGTPNFFVNGRNVIGAQPYEEFKRVIDDEIARADRLLAGGVPPAQLYAAFMKGAKASVPGPAPARAVPAGTEVYRILVGDTPRRGGVEPKVTIIEFADFQCPFCARVRATLERLLADYGADVELRFRQNPLAFHANAMPAALAAEAAREQGKFWEMHDKLFAHQEDLGREGLEKRAQELGLDMDAFRRSIDGGKGKARVQRDIDEAARFGAVGTPNFFINGRNFRGAQPYEAFKQVVDEELKKADAKLAAGTPRARLYAALTKGGLDKAATPPGRPAENTRYRVGIKSAPARGAKDALVTIVEWADFQCPFCARVEPTIAKVMDEYNGKVRVVWRDFPLSFHPNAMPAAIAARAAGEQGKFWQMHDKLYADQQHLDRETFETYAASLGLDLRRFGRALDAAKGQQAIEADVQAGQKIGVIGTPAFFINGKYLSGAQPFEAFKTKIDEELATARRLVSKGTAKGRVYEALMKGAETEVPAPAREEAEQGPEKDTTIYKVNPTTGPSRGPANAALQVVIFADFQCPFCKRLEPTLAEMEKEYGHQVRLVWKNYPLPFHDNAETAAEAAMAAMAQGKFWEMHDKLFANSNALDRASLESYAGELGLDLPRFKADLDARRYKSQIEMDTSEGTEAGVIGTPCVFINGRKIAGAYPWETFKKIADVELAKTKRRRR